MENNFIQMAASAGHVVAYTIGPIFKYIIPVDQNPHQTMARLYAWGFSVPQMLQYCLFTYPPRSK